MENNTEITDSPGSVRKEIYSYLKIAEDSQEHAELRKLLIKMCNAYAEKEKAERIAVQKTLNDRRNVNFLEIRNELKKLNFPEFKKNFRKPSQKNDVDHILRTLITYVEKNSPSNS